MYKLRELEKRDLVTINRWRSNPELMALIDAPSRFIDLEVDEKWLIRYMCNYGNTVRCSIVEEGKDEILGIASLTSIDFFNQSAEFHIIIGDKTNHKHRLETFVVKEMLKHAFNNMNLQRVELIIFEDNEREKRLFEKCGFVCEGRKRKAKLKNGKFVNTLIYAALRDDIVCERGKSNLPIWCIDTTNVCSEIDDIIRKCDKAFREPVSKRTIYPELLDKIYHKGIFLFAHTKQVMGYCAIYANDLCEQTAFISLIAVVPEYQNLHIGTNLLKVSLLVAESYHMKACVLEVQKKNLLAIKFYQSNGFTFLSEKENSFLMTKALYPILR